MLLYVQSCYIYLDLLLDYKRIVFLDFFYIKKSGMYLALIRLLLESMYLTPIRVLHQGIYLAPIRLLLKDIYYINCRVRQVFVLAFLLAENENQQLEDLPLADFGCLPVRLPLSVRTKSINENLVN